MEIVTLETPEIGDRSYIVTDGHQALVIDPQRDIDRFVAAASVRGVRIAHVVETHIHNDYLSGGLALARLTGARYGVCRDEAVAFAAERDPLADGDRFRVGELTVRVVATPGHTPNHLSYVVSHRGASSGDQQALFSGGSLLYGGAGRTDLAGPGLTSVMAGAQWTSIRHLAAILPLEATVHPTHGFGSFCSVGTASIPATAPAPTMRHERAGNPALVLAQEDFIRDLLARLVPYPRYYGHMAPINRIGAAAAQLDRSRPATLDALLARARRGEWVVDVRDRRAFAGHHLEGTINVELGNQLATYLGWVFPWGSPLSLMAASDEDLAAARRHVSRIGLEDVVGEATASQEDLMRCADTRSYPVAGFSDLSARSRADEDLLVLDVRHQHEWDAGHLAGAMHIAVPDLEGAIGSLPQDRPVWVHCAAGYRAALACSLLDRRGFDVTLIDDRWEQSRSASAA